MKFIHVSDLHIGKRLNEYSLINDQKYILCEIIKVINDNKPDCVFISGDIYDKTMPSAEAVSLLDEFLDLLAQTKSKVFIISGNHDSAERLSYGQEAFKRQDIYISPVFSGEISKVEIKDSYGKINIYLLPFIKPSNARAYLEDENIETYTDGVDALIKKLNIDEGERNILLSHQFVTGGERSESEEISIGGLDCVDASVYKKFDYVALGHLHKCQKIKDNIYYSGTPLKYSASEASGKKYVLIGQLKEKGNLEITKHPLVPMRDYIDIKGQIEEILKSENKKDFVRITLTNTETVVDAYGKLRNNYPFMTELVFQKNGVQEVLKGNFSIEKSPLEQFCDFYLSINKEELDDDKKKLVAELFENITEGE
ncbi:MAG: exonuclease SbcCD subunit D [Clostridia bacterium]